MDEYSKFSDDNQLSQRLRNGDPAAMESIFRAYSDRIYSMVYYEIGRDRQRAEDIVQETFISAIRSAHKFRGESSVYTWLVSIAHHRVQDNYRSQKRNKLLNETTLDSTSINIEMVRDTSISFQDRIESEEEHSVTWRALYSLPLHYRQALLLKYVEEMRISEISQIMQCSLKSTEGCLLRARKALLAAIEKLNTG